MLITVIDYTSGSTWIFKIPKGVEDVDSYLTELGYDLDNSYWMETNYINIDYENR